MHILRKRMETKQFCHKENVYWGRPKPVSHTDPSPGSGLLFNWEGTENLWEATWRNPPVKHPLTDREAWCPAVHVVAKSRTWWATELNWTESKTSQKTMSRTWGCHMWSYETFLKITSWWELCVDFQLAWFQAPQSYSILSFLSLWCFSSRPVCCHA